MDASAAWEHGCRECRAGQPHCHGTLIRHHGHRADLECTDSRCDHPEILLHTFTIDCEALGCQESGCGGTESAEHRKAV